MGKVIGRTRPHPAAGWGRAPCETASVAPTELDHTSYSVDKAIYRKGSSILVAEQSKRPTNSMVAPDLDLVAFTERSRSRFGSSHASSSNSHSKGSSWFERSSKKKSKTTHRGDLFPCVTSIAVK